MSASDKKKLRKEQKADKLTARQKQAQKETRKLKAYTWTFWIVIALCVCIVAGIALEAPVTNLVYRNTTALVVGEHEISATELNYFYIDTINQFVENNQYAQYYVSFSIPLNEQFLNGKDGETWADNFLTSTIMEVKNTYALYDAAVAAGHKLTAEEQKSLSELEANLEVYAQYNQYKDSKAYLLDHYGPGSNMKTFLRYYEVTMLAASYYNAHSDVLGKSYTPAVLREYEGEKPYEYNSYFYAYHFINLDMFKVGGTVKDGKTEYSDEEIQAARDLMKIYAKKLTAEGIDTVEELNEAIKQMEIELAELKEANPPVKPEDDKTEGDKTEGDKTEGDKTEGDKPEDDKTEGDKTEDDKDKEEEKPKEPTYSACKEYKHALYSSVGQAMQEWIRNPERQPGDIKAIEQTASRTVTKDGKEETVIEISGFYVTLFNGVTDNNFKYANVRHLLISFAGEGKDSKPNATYTDEQKETAKKAAQELYDKWIADGDLTEESFTKLVKEKTHDTASKETGGLYEEISPTSSYVENFKYWCFEDGRKAGDHGIVETEYGYHIMYYVGEGKTEDRESYRDVMVAASKLTEDMEAWNNSLTDKISCTEKETKYVRRDFVINPYGSLGY